MTTPPPVFPVRVRAHAWMCVRQWATERESERQRVSMCVRVKYRWRRPVCVRVSEVQCNCRQSQPYLPVKNTIIPHSPSQAISPVSSSLALFLSLTLSLSDSNYNLEGYFSPGQKHSPQALPLLSDSPFSSPRRFLPFPLFFSHSHPFLFLCWELESGNEQAVNTHHLSQCMLLCICFGESPARLKAVVYEARGAGYSTRRRDVE